MLIEIAFTIENDVLVWGECRLQPSSCFSNADVIEVYNHVTATVTKEMLENAGLQEPLNIANINFCRKYAYDCVDVSTMGCVIQDLIVNNAWS